MMRGLCRTFVTTQKKFNSKLAFLEHGVSLQNVSGVG